MSVTRPMSPSKPLNVGIIAPPWVAVPPPVYGGTELVIDNLARGLMEKGHHVTLFTTGDSTCPVPRRWLHDRAVGTTADLMVELSHVEAAYAELVECDIIHDHTLLGLLWAGQIPHKGPVVTTVHGPFTQPLASLYEAVGERIGIIAISEHQRSTGPTVPVDTVIHHGIEVDKYPIGNGDGDFVLFLGRMSADKGVHRAIDVARAAGKQIVIAAKMWEPDEHRYFHEVVEPMLGDDAIYVGPVGGQRKADLLAGAEALINPIMWPEPFGLVMIEALAAGTPVLAFPQGAAPEIVDHGVTGYLSEDEGGMIEHLTHIGDLDRAACRRAAENRFSVGRMVDDHLDLYRRLIAHAPIDLTDRPTEPTSSAVDPTPARH